MAYSEIVSRLDRIVEALKGENVSAPVENESSSSASQALFVNAYHDSGDTNYHLGSSFEEIAVAFTLGKPVAVLYDGSLNGGSKWCALVSSVMQGEDGKFYVTVQVQLGDLAYTTFFSDSVSGTLRNYVLLAT